MKIIVTGSSGLLGHEVWNLLERDHDLVALGRQQPGWVDTPRFRTCDLTNAALTYSLVTKENPEVIVHCAAYNHVDAAEENFEAAYQANALANRNLALACQRFDTTLLSVSSDQVFDGESALPSGYREFDSCRPISRYGESKRWGEVFVQTLIQKYFIVRTSWLFGPSRATWVDHVAADARERKTVNTATDMTSSPTYAPDLAQAIKRLAESRHYGIYHLSNQGFCTRAELAEEVLRVNKIDSTGLIRRVTRADLHLPAPRPRFSPLENLMWRLDGFPPMRPWKEALREHFAKAKVSAS